jgi:uncharacterized membrane protein YfcA
MTWHEPPAREGYGPTGGLPMSGASVGPRALDADPVSVLVLPLVLGVLVGLFTAVLGFALVAATVLANADAGSNLISPATASLVLLSVALVAPVAAAGTVAVRSRQRVVHPSTTVRAATIAAGAVAGAILALRVPALFSTVTLAMAVVLGAGVLLGRLLARRFVRP